MTGRGVAQDTSGVRANAVLSGQVAVVTGATKGLGLAIAREFLNSGASVMIASRREAAVNETVASLGAACGDLARVRGMSADVADLAQVEALGKAANGWHGHLDIWVNNAGITAPYGPSMALDPHAFTGVIHTNVLGTYHGSLVALRYLVPRGQGRLINILGRGDRQVDGVSRNRGWHPCIQPGTDADRLHDRNRGDYGVWLETPRASRGAAFDRDRPRGSGPDGCLAGFTGDRRQDRPRQGGVRKARTNGSRRPRGHCVAPREGRTSGTADP